MADVSVVVPFRNRGALLAETCRSLAFQSHRNWEALLVNDGSDDDHRQVASGFATRDSRFRLIDVPAHTHEPGPWLARNLGIQQAQAPLVAFLDSDDLWHPHKLQVQLGLHQGQPIDLSVTSYVRFRRTKQGNRVIGRRTPPATLNYRRLMAGNVLPLSSVIVTRRLLEVASSPGEGPFRPERHEDFGLWLRLFSLVPQLRYACLNETLLAYRLHAGSLSAKRWRSYQAVSLLLAQHSRHRAHHTQLLFRWGYHRIREQGQGIWPLLSGRTEPLPQAFEPLWPPQGEGDFPSHLAG